LSAQYSNITLPETQFSGDERDQGLIGFAIDGRCVEPYLQPAADFAQHLRNARTRLHMDGNVQRSGLPVTPGMCHYKL
jgi:hypothetical protein